MPGTSFDSDADFDPQDQAEAFDESMTVGGEGSVALGGDSPLDVGSEMRSFEELPDVEDLTQVAGDRDDDEAVALDADEFDPDAIDDADFEDDNELDYRASDEEHEDDIDGLGPEDGFDAGEVSAKEIDGLHEVRDAGEAEGGEDDFTDFQAKTLSDADLKEMGYAEDRDGQVRAKPNR
jgi:hypothetical protein